MTKKTSKSVTLGVSRFGGIDLGQSASEKSASDSVNFRLMPDGSLKKRNGYRYERDLGDIPDYAMETYDSDRHRVIYMDFDDYFYKYDVDTDELTAVTDLGTSDDLRFLRYKDGMILLDGEKITDPLYRFPNATEGYAPLYKKDLDPYGQGEIYEPLNLLTSRFRVSYKIVEGVGGLVVPSAAKAVQLVIVNGETLETTDYSFDAETHVLSSSRFSSGSAVTVFATTTSNGANVQSAMLAGCTRAVNAGDGDNSIVFLYGNPDEDYMKYIFRSRPVSDASFAEAKLVSSYMKPLYFPDTDKFYIGVGEKTVTSILPVGDLAVIFASDEAWTVSLYGDVRVSKLNSSVGCSSEFCSALCGECPITVSGGHVYLWKPNLASYNDLSAELISSPVEKLLSQMNFYRCRCFNYKYGSEFWMCDMSAGSPDEILVYNYALGVWYTYSGFKPKFCFGRSDGCYFIAGSKFCSFDPDITCDVPEEASDAPISASYSGGWSDFGLPGHIKIPEYAALRALSPTGEIGITVEYDNGTSESETVPGSPGAPVIPVKRLVRHRFRQLRFTVTATSEDDVVIYGLTVAAKVCDRVSTKK